VRGRIVSRFKGSYSIVLDIGKDPVTGKRQQHFESIKGTRKEAEKRLNELLHELGNGTFVKPGKLTVSDFLKSWLTDYVRLNESSRTHELYSYMCEKHITPDIGKIVLSELKPQNLQHLYSEKLDHGRLDGQGGLGGRTVQLIHVTIHKALQYGLKMGLVNRNVADGVEIPRVKRHEMRTLSESDVNVFLNSVKDSEYYTLWYTYLHTGARRSELLAVQWLNINLYPLDSTLSITRSLEYIDDKKIPASERIKFKAPKTVKSRRLIDLTPSNAVVLRKYREAQDKLKQSLGLPALTDNDLVFSHFNGSPLLPQSITHAWMKAVRKAGFYGIRLHDTRHTHASIMLTKEIHPKVVSERLGHAGIAITMDLYSHVTRGMQHAAAAKFDEISVPKESKLDKELDEIIK
jgi:integrase